MAIGISLLFSPPTLHTDSATGASTATGLPDIDSPDRLTVSLAQTLGDGEFGVAAKDLTTGETYSFGLNQPFDAASTMKLLFASYMYHQASNNQLDLNEMITIPAGDVQHYGTGVIQYQAGPYQFSYRELARLMMEKSDNTAGYVLAKKLDEQGLQDYAGGLGMSQTSVANNQTAAVDMVKLDTAIYQNRVADPELTKELLGILDDSAFEDRLPAKLPNGAKVYHKTGDALGGGLHDTGIVVYRGHAYAVAIFTDNQGANQDRTKARMADASRDIFAYFNRRP